MRRIVIVLLVTGLMAEFPLVGQDLDPPAPTRQSPAQVDQGRQGTLSEQLDHWIAELGAATFQRREAAVVALVEVGSPALPRLQLARESGDREVRSRAIAIYLRILQQDYQNRISMFEAGNTEAAAISSWGRFATQFGDTKANRVLFVLMLRSSPELMLFLEGDRERLAKAIGGWINKANRSGTVFGSPTFSVGSMAALSFCSLKAPENLSNVNTKIFATIRYNAKIRTEATTGQHAGTLKKMLACLVAQEDRELVAALRCCMLFDLKQVGLEKASEILAGEILGPGGNSKSVLVEALLVGGQFGSEPEKKVLERFLGAPDRYAVFSLNKKTFTTTVGDVALAVLWTMHGIDPTEKGFADGVQSQLTGINAHLAGFASEEERQNARQAWIAFRGNEEGK
ncbi:MAG: hypothetical protein VB878_02445 [Pirellulaceae bacterium]